MAASEKISANAVGARTARPCDSCLCKRARWYCAADDAFLCQACDASVHSANQLALRHERVSLRTSGGMPTLRPEQLPPWLCGFRRKARSQRQPKPRAAVEPPSCQISLLVPDLSSCEEPSPADDEKLLYSVPVYDPHAADGVILPSDRAPAVESRPPMEQDRPAAAAVIGFDAACDADVDLASLLGKDLDSNCFCIDALGLIDACDEQTDWHVKIEAAEEPAPVNRRVDSDIDISFDAMELKFDYDTPTSAMECEEEAEADKIHLRLDHESVVTAWGGRGSPWINGERQTFNLDDCWTELCVFESHQQQFPVARLVSGGGDNGREARVLRYKEKRRSRLFSKKIRYEVRRLNAEKRPRMKGRFVKRASLVQTPASAIASSAQPVFSF